MVVRICLPAFACGFVLFSLVGAAGETPDDAAKGIVRLRLIDIETSTLLDHYKSLVKRELGLQDSVRACIKSGDARLVEYQQALHDARGDLDVTKKKLVAIEAEKVKLKGDNVPPQLPGTLDADRVGQAAGSKATTTPDGVVRLSWPRSDVAVTIDGLSYKPFAGLGSWAAFTRAKHGAMLMGDTVVFQDEVSPAMDAAFANGLEVTALHNHFFYDEPKVYFMHIGGQGDPEKLAKGVKAVWDAIKKVRTDQPEPATRFAGEVPKAGNITAGPLEKLLGQKSESQKGVVKFTIGRHGSMHGVKVGGSMGLTTWAAFSGSDSLSAVAGDFIMTAAEVQPVLRALRKANIHIVALHNHMIGEQPAFYFTHFWAKGPAEELAQGIKAALQAQKEAGKGHSSAQLAPTQKGGPRALDLPGQVEAAEQTMLFTKIAGLVQKVHVDIGDRVKKGQVLAELSMPEIAAELRQKAALIVQADAEVELARGGVKAAEAALALAGAQVEEGEAGIKRARANYDHRKAEYERLQKLGKNHVIDQQVLDEGLHRLESAKASLAEAEAKVKGAKTAREGSAAKRAMAQAEVKVAMARHEVAKAEVQRVDTILQYSKVHAPFDGLIARRNVDSGALAGPGGGNKAEPLFVVVRIDSVRISVAIPEAAVPFVSTGALVRVRFPAFKGKDLEAKVTRLAGVLDPDTRTLRAEIDLPNPDGKLLPGMFAVVAIAGPNPLDEPEKDARPKDAASQGDVKALLRAQLDAARKAYDEAVRGSQQTKRVEALIMLLVRPQEVCVCSRNVLNAERDMSTKKEDRIAALEGHLKRMKELEPRAKEMHKNGLVPIVEVFIVEFHRLRAELRLAGESKEETGSSPQVDASLPGQD